MISIQSDDITRAELDLAKRFVEEDLARYMPNDCSKILELINTTSEVLFIYTLHHTRYHISFELKKMIFLNETCRILGKRSVNLLWPMLPNP
jgi:hypothetical protein